MEQKVAELEEQVAFLNNELERYKAMFKLAQRNKFGPKSERVEELPELFKRMHILPMISSIKKIFFF
jgi:hypothetical protein